MCGKIYLIKHKLAKSELRCLGFSNHELRILFMEKKSPNFKFLLLILKVDRRKPKLAARLDLGCYRDENTIVLNSFGSYVYFRFCVVLEIKPRTLLSYTETYLYVF